MQDPSFPLPSAFVALPLEGAAKEEFLRLRALLAPYAEFLSLQKADTPHLTVRFWKSLMEIEYDQLLAECETVAAKSAPFRLRIAGVDTFGSRGEDRVLFLVPEFSPPLAELKKRCPWPNEQPFQPHVTLARVRHPNRFSVHRKKILRLVEGADFTMEVDRLRLFAKIGGANQTPIRDFPFGQK